jgi:hypothetical protein
MGGYDANFDQPLDDKYKCPVCLTALRDPIQTKCGHRLCSSCFKQIRGYFILIPYVLGIIYFSNKSTACIPSGNWYFRCPVDNTWSNHVFEDNAAKREVLSLATLCNNETCDWRGELREIQVTESGPVYS